jgi:uncharacterized protein
LTKYVRLLYLAIQIYEKEPSLGGSFGKVFLMIVDLKTISESPRHFHLSYESDWWKDGFIGDPIVGLDTPLKAHVAIHRAGAKIILEGQLSGGLKATCDRCLGTYRRDISSKFRLFLVASSTDSGQSEMELKKDETSVDFVIDDTIDLGEVLRQQIYLNMPMKSLCSQSCAGLCPYCGTNMNLKECHCERPKGYGAFSRLENFRVKRK